ncbi:hypothetical protein [Streptomyces sp. SPB162]|nr:hypothetical protein [Streptomyces sp. SPB162]MDF9814927.1 hypothetical protein [Streptomyces sp. SPB162]
MTMLRAGQDMAAPDAQGVSSATVDVPQLHIASLDALLAGWRWEAVR